MKRRGGKKGIVLVIMLLFVGTGGASAFHEKQPDISRSVDFGNVLYVDDTSPCPGNGTEKWPYCKIQYAIDNASVDTIILVAPGRYYEHLIIWPHLNKLTIKKGDISNPVVEDPILIGNGTGTGITIKASDVMIDRLTITNYGQESRDAGIYVEWNPKAQTSKVKIENCSISRVYNGISMTRDDGTGYIQTAHHIYGNYIHNITMRGITIILIDENTITANTIRNCTFGFYLMDTNKNKIKDNHISKCRTTGGVIDVGVGNEILKNNFIENYGGLWTGHTKGSRIQNNNFIDNTRYPASFKTFFIINRPINNDRWFQNYWGRPPLLILVYPIFGVYINQFNEPIPWIRFDVLPSWGPN